MDRRKFLLAAALASPILSSCQTRLNAYRQWEGLPPISDRESQCMQRFDRVGAVMLRFDAFGEKKHINLFTEENLLIAIRSVLSPTEYVNVFWERSTGCPLPITARVRWRDKGLGFTAENRAMVNDFESQNPYAYFGGNILGDYTIPVADRIPDELIAKYLEFKSGSVWFHLKFRVHDDGLLLGWHLGNSKERIMAGGDFEEAHYLRYIGENGKRYRQWVQGWFIHPVTNEKILTDF